MGSYLLHSSLSPLSHCNIPALVMRRHYRQVSRMAKKPPPNYSGYYTLWPRDQSRDNWVLFRKTKASPKKRPELGSTFYRFFGNPVAPEGLEIRPQYRDLLCPDCGGFDPYRAFPPGFDADIKIRINGDFALSSDNLLLISSRMLEVLKEERVGGFEVKPVGRDGWSVLKITQVVDADPEVIKRVGESCSTCNRPREAFRIYKRLSEMSVPTEKNTFFTVGPMRCSPSLRADRREVLITGEVVTALKRHGIKGDSCHRLLTEEEWHEVERREQAGNYKPLPDTCVLLY